MWSNKLGNIKGLELSYILNGNSSKTTCTGSIRNKKQDKTSNALYL